MKKLFGIALVGLLGLALSTAACGPKAQSTSDTKVAPPTGATGGTGDGAGGAGAGGGTTAPSSSTAPSG
jgi:hypothetical protein